MSGPGVPQVPQHVASRPELARFAEIWAQVLQWEAEEGRTPMQADQCCVLAVPDLEISGVVPMDVVNPFSVDRQLQETLIRRHVLTEPVRPDDPRLVATPAGGQPQSVTNLDGGRVTLGRDDKGAPTFTSGESTQPWPAQLVGDGSEPLLVYAVEVPFVSFDEVMAGVGRYNQRNPHSKPYPYLPPFPPLEE